jgi:hypothetical protein
MTEIRLSGGSRLRTTAGTHLRLPPAVTTATISNPAPLQAGDFASIGQLGFTVTLPADPGVTGDATITVRVLCIIPVAAYAGNEQNPDAWTAAGAIYIGNLDEAGATINASGLTAATQYVVVWECRDTTKTPRLDSLWSVGYTITTASPSSDTTPPVLTAVGVSSIGSSTSQLNWTTDEGGAFEWRVERQSDNVVVASGSGSNAAGAHSVAASGLAASTAYRFEIDQQDAAGNLAQASANFTTQAASGSTLIYDELPYQDFDVDSGAWRGLNSGAVPVRFKASSGQAVAARLVPINGDPALPWVTVGTGTGTGNQITGFYNAPRHRSAMTIEVRLVSAPSVTAIGVNRVRVGHVIQMWGQSEDDQLEQTLSGMPTPETLSVKNAVEALVQPWATGRQSTAALKVPGVDAFPTGITRSGAVITVGASFASGGIIEDWDFRQHRVLLAAGANVGAIRQCIFGDPGELIAEAFFLDSEVGATCARLEWNTFEGWTGLRSPDLGTTRALGVSACIKSGVSGSGTAITLANFPLITRNRFTNYPNDAIKAYGTDTVQQVITLNYFGPPLAFGNDRLAYSAGRTYLKGEVADNGGESYICRVNTSLGVAPPAGTATDNANWLYVDPHCDTIQVPAAKNGVEISLNWVDGRASLRNRGINSCIFLQRNVPADQITRIYDDVFVQHNIIRWTLGAGGSVIKCSDGGGVNWTTPTIRNNWLDPRRSTGSSTYIDGQQSAMNWGGNKDYATGAAIPASAVAAAISVAALGEPLDSRVQFWSLENSTRHVESNSASGRPAGFAAFAHALLAIRPDEFFTIIRHTKSGTAWMEASNNDPGRPWADEAALATAARGGISPPGLCWSSWYASPGPLRLSYGEVWAGFFLGLKPDGTAFAGGGALTHIQPDGSGTQNTTYGNILPDLYDVTNMRFLLMDSHRFESQGATRTIVEGSPEVGLTQHKRECTDAGRLLKANGLFSARFAGENCSLNAYQTGLRVAPGGSASAYDPNGTSYTDEPHPFKYGPDGAQRRARMLAYFMLMAGGLLNLRVPVFDQVLRHTDGSVMRVGCSTGPVTTTRRARGEPSISDTGTHRTDATCFVYGNVYVHRAEIRSDGRVYIYPRSGTLPTSGVDFGLGGADGQLNHPADQIAQMWKDYPIRGGDGLPFIEGLPFAVQPPAMDGTHPTGTFTVPS